MANRVHTISTPARRRRPRAVAATGVICPTRLQVALAYLRNGDALPFGLMCDSLLTGGIGLCLALGFWMGSTL